MEMSQAQEVFLGWMDTAAGRLFGSGLSIVIILVLAAASVRFFRAAVGRLAVALEKRAALDKESPEAIAKRTRTLSGILRSAGIVFIWSVAFITVLKEAGIDIAPILAGAGVVGLAVGFGAQNLVRDVISGFFIILENQVRVGDVAVINGTGGLVEAINLRTIVLRDLHGVVHVFPNGTVATLSNMTMGWSAMVYEIGVAYKEDTDRVVEVMKEVAADLQGDSDYGPKLLEPLEVFGVEAFGDSDVVIKARQKTKPMEQWNVGREYRRRLKKAFDQKGIEIPFPHRTLYWGEASKPLEALVRGGAGNSS